MERLGITDEQLAQENFDFFGHRPEELKSSEPDTDHLQMLRGSIFRKVMLARQDNAYDATKETPPLGAYSRDDPATHALYRSDKPGDDTE